MGKQFPNCSTCVLRKNKPVKAWRVVGAIVTVSRGEGVVTDLNESFLRGCPVSEMSCELTLSSVCTHRERYGLGHRYAPWLCPWEAPEAATTQQHTQQPDLGF